ncbi:MAG TPA: flagellar hook-associated protein FlgK [Acidimicrobiia bacterium]|jgi:flagellar hook-associated protein 1 FlgK
MSDFSGLNIALTGLYASQRALMVTGQNVTNANTDGYSREAVDLEPVDGVFGPSLWTNNSSAPGGGVSVTGVTRFRAEYLEVNAALARGAQSQLSTSSATLSSIETMFGEPSDDSLAAGLDGLWSSFAAVANNPSDPGARAALLAQGTTVASTFNSMSSQLTQLSSDSLSQLSALTSEINTTAANIASLNGQIGQATLSGSDPSALEDQRDSLVQQLATDAGATVRPGANGTVNVFVGGSALVSGQQAETLALDTSGSSVSLDWVNAGHAALVTSGTAGGLLNTINTVVPGYQQSLNTVAMQLKSDVNTLHSAGVGLDGSTGLNFFDGTSAADISLSADVAGQPDKIAAGAASGGSLDGSVALQLSDLGQSATGADAQYRALIANLGVDSQGAQRNSTMQDATVQQIDASRQSVSGVNTDEEMVSMVQFQNAYNASARFLTTIDQMLDTLVNHTGVVGM